jgi:hypothetical protein
MSSNRKPLAPRTLDEPGKDLWRKLTAAFTFDVHELTVLELACQALDRVNRAQTVINEAPSLTYLAEPHNVPKPIPELAVADREAKLVASLLKALKIPASDGKPSGHGGRRKSLKGTGRVAKNKAAV